MLIYQAAKQTLLKLESRSKLYERYKLKRSDKHQMSKLAIVAMKLLTSGGCDKKRARRRQLRSFRTSATALNLVLEFEAEVYPLRERERAFIHHDYTTIRDIAWHVSKNRLDNKNIDCKHIFQKNVLETNIHFTKGKIKNSKGRNN